MGGVIIDATHQGRGRGRAAVLAALDRLSDHGSTAGFALFYEDENTAAARLYGSLGFAPTGERVDDEVVTRRPPQVWAPDRRAVTAGRAAGPTRRPGSAGRRGRRGRSRGSWRPSRGRRRASGWGRRRPRPREPVGPRR
ncbi:GNAT family N-acetyltransferase [Nostocoides veronense]|uniref:GNAT family N-acetyltransferase n=1 Tax=Nostocoides veronense TaxID=330836 RepID=UPI003CD093FD